MYAIIEDRGKQYRVREGDIIEVDLLNTSEKKIVFDRVLYLSDEKEDIKIGTPIVEGAKVEASILGEVKGEKIYPFKFKRRKGYKRKIGFRAKYTRVKIEKISG